MVRVNLTGPEFPPQINGNPKQLMIMLHGLGADGNDLISLSSYFAPSFPSMGFISPHAPFPCDFSPFGFQWFSLLEFSLNSVERGVQQAIPYLRQLLDDKMKQWELSPKQIFILGFSQGTMLGLEMALFQGLELGGLIGFSGLLAPHGSTVVATKTPCCLIHGTYDQVVPHGALGEASKQLHALGIPYEAHSIEQLGHGINDQGLEAALAFLRKGIVTV